MILKMLYSNFKINAYTVIELQYSSNFWNEIGYEIYFPKIGFHILISLKEGNY